MSLTLQLPKEFTDELKEHIYQAYKEALHQARQDLGVIKSLYSIEETCQYLGISRNTLINYFELGLPRYQIERKIYVKKKEIDEFISNHQL